MTDRAGFKIEAVPAQMPLQPFTRFKAVCGCGWESHVCSWAQAAKTLGERHVETKHPKEEDDA